MRVRISYSVDLDDVPNESIRMLDEAIKHLEEVKSSLKSVSNSIENLTMSKEKLAIEMDKNRAILGAIDSRVSDVGMIMTGFYDAKQQIAASEEEEDGEPADVLASHSYGDVSIDPKEVEKYVK